MSLSHVFVHGGNVGVDLGNGLADQFAMELSEVRCQKSLDETLIERADEIAEQKYDTTGWLQRR